MSYSRYALAAWAAGAAVTLAAWALFFNVLLPMLPAPDDGPYYLRNAPPGGRVHYLKWAWFWVALLPWACVIPGHWVLKRLGIHPPPAGWKHG